MVSTGYMSRLGQPLRASALRLATLMAGMVFFLSLAGQCARAGDTVASRFDLTGDEATTQFSAVLSDDIGYTASVLPDPYRVLIDMANVTFDLPPGAGRKPKGLVKAIRYGVVEEGKSRIVIDTTGPVLITRSVLVPKAGKKPARITIELTSISKDVFDAAFAIDRSPPESETAANAPAVETEQAATAGEEVAAPEQGDIVGSVTPAEEFVADTPVIKPTLKPEKPEAAQAVSSERADGKKVIVIDPGHGGIDPGALSPGKTLEKDVVLSFAKDLRDLLERDGRHHVELTREDDRFISLKDRVAFARKHGADLFIAIHADTLRGQTVTGTTLYTLSEKASDAESEELAQRENRADAISGVNLSGQSEEVAGILIDLAQRDSRNKASLFSRQALAQLKTVTKMTGKPIRSAGFTVLKSPEIPSLLIELGFLSNPKDEERLRSAAWRKTMAKALATAIDTHFAPAVAQNP